MKRLITLLSVGIIGIYISSAQAALPKTTFMQSSQDENSGDDSDDGDEYTEDDISFDLGMNLPGDQYIKIALGLCLPLNFPDFESTIKGDSQLKLGGIGSLGYHYFLTSKMAIGFDVSFGFNVSIGSHVFNYVPLHRVGQAHQAHAESVPQDGSLPCRAHKEQCSTSRNCCSRA